MRGSEVKPAYSCAVEDERGGILGEGKSEVGREDAAEIASVKMVVTGCETPNDD